ncbi:MAG: hypothetical protein GX158_03235 [Bacteroidales bacterium]|nr:hypothetical protein [Bacteroidales bacterium]
MKINASVVFTGFGVSGGCSFRWGLNECINEQSGFIGFDTFEGLPDAIGIFE